jgi:hypothetical protein
MTADKEGDQSNDHNPNASDICKHKGRVVVELLTSS